MRNQVLGPFLLVILAVFALAPMLVEIELGESGVGGDYAMRPIVQVSALTQAELTSDNGPFIDPDGRDRLFLGP